MVLKLKKAIQKYGIVTIVEKSMYAILLLLSFVAIMGTVYKVYDVAQKAGSPIGFVTVSMISLGILFFLFCLYIFYRIEKVVLERQKYLTILLFFVMFILYAVVFSYYRVLPVTDSFIDLDIAAYMANGGIVDSGNVMAKYVAAYPNNYFFIVLCTLILKPIISLPEFSIFQIFENFGHFRTARERQRLSLEQVTEWLATGARPEGTQAMSKTRACSSREHG